MDDILHTIKQRRRLPHVSSNHWEYNRRAYKFFRPILNEPGNPEPVIVPGTKFNFAALFGKENANGMKTTTMSTSKSSLRSSGV